MKSESLSVDKLHGHEEDTEDPLSCRLLPRAPVTAQRG